MKRAWKIVGNALFEPWVHWTEDPGEAKRWKADPRVRVTLYVRFR